MNLAIKRRMKPMVNPARTYAHSLARPRNSAFVIFGLGRSGSTLLTELLDDHPDIRCEKEILSRKRLNPYLYVRGRRSVTNASVYGFKVKIWHLTDVQGISDPAIFLRRLANDGWSIVHLWRRNVVRTAISTLLAARRGQYAVKDKAVQSSIQSKRIYLAPSRVLEVAKGIEGYRRQEDEILQAFAHVSVNYEDDLLDRTAWNATAGRIFDHLGVPKVSVSSDLKRTTTDDLSLILENFAEIKDELQAIGYDGYLQN